MTITLAELQADREAGTPGPWKADADIVGWNNGRDPACAVMFQTSGDRSTGMGGWSPVAWAMPNSKTEFETVANARRIARLPDTEAALIEAVGVLAIFTEIVDDQLAGEFPEPMQRARALLAKLGADK